MDYLNLGCGYRIHPDWTNVDFTSTQPGVMAHNLTQGIPFGDDTFDVVYHSHVLEHFSQADAIAFLQECYRVLRPGGVLRVVVPDLEQIARTYLLTLENACLSAENWNSHYDWMTLELLDQLVRNRPGGEMLAYFAQATVPNSDFIVKRLGSEAKIMLEAGRSQSHVPQATASQPKRFLQQVYHFLRDRTVRRETLFKLLLRQDYAALQIGRFRQQGEIHQWMYDRYSLKRLLHQCEFEAIVQRTASESYMSHWTDFNLDTEADGAVYKPDSIFVEALKPT